MPEDLSGARRVLVAAVNELRELRLEFLERGMNEKGLTAEIVRLVARITELERKEWNE